MRSLLSSMVDFVTVSCIGPIRFVNNKNTLKFVFGLLFIIMSAVFINIRDFIQYNERKILHPGTKFYSNRTPRYFLFGQN